MSNLRGEVIELSFPNNPTYNLSMDNSATIDMPIKDNNFTYNMNLYYADAHWDKYEIARYKTVYVSSITDYSRIYLDSYSKYLPNEPPVPNYDEEMYYDFTNGLTTKSFENDKESRWYISHSDVLRTSRNRDEVAAVNYCAYWIKLTKAQSVWSLWWSLSGDIYGLVDNGLHAGTYVETVYADPGTYPDNGIQDGYWYILQS